MVPCDWFQEDVEVAEELPFSDAVVNMEVDSLGMEVDLFGPKPSDANSVQQQMSHDGGLELPPTQAFHLDHDPCAENAGYPDNAIGQMRGDRDPVAAVDDGGFESPPPLQRVPPDGSTEVFIAEMDYEAERLHGTDDVGTTPTPVAKGIVYTVTTERINVFMAVFMSQQPFALDTTPIPYTVRKNMRIPPGNIGVHKTWLIHRFTRFTDSPDSLYPF